MTTEKAQKVLDAMKKRDREASKSWKPYDGPPDLDFIAESTKEAAGGGSQ